MSDLTLGLTAAGRANPDYKRQRSRHVQPLIESCRDCAQTAVVNLLGRQRGRMRDRLELIRSRINGLMP